MAGRPKAKIDWNFVGKALEADCSAVSIAAAIGIEEDTLRKRCPADNKCSFSEFSQQKKSKGDNLLRMKQFQTAMGGSIPMQIWLGKQRLGQSDKSDSNLNVSGELNVGLKQFRESAQKQYDAKRGTDES